MGKRVSGRGRGWRNESQRHRLASMGYSTRQSFSQQHKSNGINEKDITYYTEQGELDDLKYSNDLNIIFLRLKDGDALILDDGWNTRALIWELDGKIYAKLMIDIEQNYDTLWMRFNTDEIDYDEFVKQVNIMYPDMKASVEISDNFPTSSQKLKIFLRNANKELRDELYEAESKLNMIYGGK